MHGKEHMSEFLRVGRASPGWCAQRDAHARTWGWAEEGENRGGSMQVPERKVTRKVSVHASEHRGGGVME
jgi:hypothetical protein